MRANMGDDNVRSDVCGYELGGADSRRSRVARFTVRGASEPTRVEKALMQRQVIARSLTAGKTLDTASKSLTKADCMKPYFHLRLSRGVRKSMQ